MVPLGERSRQFFSQCYRPINDFLRAIFLFWSLKRGKRLQNDGKYGIFQNWLVTRPKMETHEPTTYTTILGGVSQGFWCPFLDLGAQSPIFSLEKGHFPEKNIDKL